MDTKLEVGSVSPNDAKPLVSGWFSQKFYNLKIGNLFLLILFLFSMWVFINFMSFKRPDMKLIVMFVSPIFILFGIGFLYILNLHLMVLLFRFLFKDAHRLEVGAKTVKQVLEPQKYKTAINVSFFLLWGILLIFLLINSH